MLPTQTAGITYARVVTKIFLKHMTARLTPRGLFYCVWAWEESNRLPSNYKFDALPMSYRPVCLFIAYSRQFGYSSSIARVAQWLEHHIDIVGAGGSIPPVRTNYIYATAGAGLGEGVVPTASASSFITSGSWPPIREANSFCSMVSFSMRRFAMSSNLSRCS